MLPSRWLLTCAALLAFASGCSGGRGGPDTKLVLYPVAGKGGIITYSTKDPYDPAFEAQRRAALWDQQRRDDLNRVRQENIRAESMSRQARFEQFRQEQRALWAYQDARRANVQADLRRQMDRERWEIAGQSSRQVGSWPEAEAVRLEQESRALDGALFQVQQQQYQQAQQRQQESLRRQEPWRYDATGSPLQAPR
jgi:hypothetical protein